MATSPSAPARPKFHDPDLAVQLATAAPRIESFTTRLNNLSADIKSLESYLERSAVRVRVCVTLSERLNGGGEYVTWDQNGSPERWRIWYEKGLGGSFINDDAIPLIEAPVDVRVRARRLLPELLRNVGQEAGLGQDDNQVEAGRAWGEDEPASAESAGPPPSDEDIPF
jgi:hypothetical protein